MTTCHLLNAVCRFICQCIKCCATQMSMQMRQGFHQYAACQLLTCVYLKALCR